MKKSPLIALALSIVPGLGQMYALGFQNGFKRGLFFLGSIGVSLWFCLIGIGFIMVPVIWLWAAIDAAGLAAQINKGGFGNTPAV
jgi:hypothetical protein